MNNIEKFNSFYKETSKGINDRLKEYNDSLVKDKKGYLKDNLSLFANLNSEGKLVRGFLIALGYKLLNSNADYSYDLSLAYEIFQTSILIHDDIIDNDDLRRGKDTIHFANYKKYKEFNDSSAKKMGESIAICMGDYGFFDINKILLRYKNDKNS